MVGIRFEWHKNGKIRFYEASKERRTESAALRLISAEISIAEKSLFCKPFL